MKSVILFRVLPWPEMESLRQSGSARRGLTWGEPARPVGRSALTLRISRCIVRRHLIGGK